MSAQATEITETIDSRTNDAWNELVSYLQTNVWLEHEVVLRALEEAIATNQHANRVKDDRAFNLARLRLALIQAEVQAAPVGFSYEGNDEAVLWNFLRETARFFKSISPYIDSGPDSLIHVEPKELPTLKAMAKELANQSWRGDDLIQIRYARSAREHRRIRGANPNVFSTAELLKTQEHPIGSAPLRADVMDSRAGTAAVLDRISK